MSPTSRRQFMSQASLVAASTVGTLATSAHAQGKAPSATSRIRSISAMTMTKDGKLVVADWQAGQLHALELPVLAATKEAGFNVNDLSDRLGRAFAMDGASIRITAMATHEPSQSAILALALGRAVDSPVALVIVDTKGNVRKIDVNTAIASSHTLAATSSEAKVWGAQPVRTFTVTAIKQFGDELIVTGLANASFNSAVRRVAYPFTTTKTATSSVEMYHAVHNQIETRAPVRAFSVIDVAGKPTMLAAYTCTPLVTIPMEQLQDGAKVRGKTIAELGFGNTPLDVVPFAITYKGKTSDWVLIANSAKSADLISLPEIVKAAQADGLSKPVNAPFDQFAGVKTIPVPITGAQRVLDQGPQFLLVLRRNADSGQLQLVSVRKGAFFRLSDFVNEYDFPDYAYPAEDRFQQDYIRPFHKMMKSDEGHSALVK
jgi:hypothetical protein